MPIKRHTLDFPHFMLHELGSIGQPLAFLHRLFIRPFLAPSFPAFWRDWNPAYRYFLALYFYRPLRRWFSRGLAVFLTFVGCGLLLHDLPFFAGYHWLHGEFALPTGAILFSIFALLTLLSERVRLDLSGYPVIIRAAANVGWIVLSIVLCRLVIGLLLWLKSKS
jgi:D-alanyl-lipoteichoic acid acyltransferase DltB (MBOAT superfamily)